MRSFGARAVFQDFKSGRYRRSGCSQVLQDVLMCLSISSGLSMDHNGGSRFLAAASVADRNARHDLPVSECHLAPTLSALAKVGAARASAPNVK